MEEATAQEVQDVNQADSSSADSGSHESQSSAETLNTEEDRGPIPYDRFKEVNDEKVKLNEQLKEMQDSQDWQGYQRLKTALDNDPGFADHFLKSVQGYGNQEQTQEKGEDPLAEYPSEIADPLRRTQQLEQTVQQLMQNNQLANERSIRSEYVNRFNQLMTDSKIPDYAKDHYAQAVEVEAGKIASSQGVNGMGAFDQKLIDKAFENVNNSFKSLERNIRGSYQVEKTTDALPASASATGTTARTQTKTRSSEDRSAMISELLRAGHRD